MKLLGIDLGTTSLSFIVLESETGKLLKTMTIANESFILSDYEWEKIQDPEKIWKIVEYTLQQLNLKAEGIEAIGITGQMHGILYVNKDGMAVSPLYTWQDGSGNQKYKENVTYVKQLSLLTNYPVATGFGAVTYYVHQNQSKLSDAVVTFCTIGDYIGMRLTGRKSPLLESTNAASLGLFEKKNRMFDREAILRAKLDPDKFPKVAEGPEILGYTKEGIKVATAIGDNQASFLGAVKDKESSILVNVGTGSQISFLVPEYKEIAGMETRPFVDHNYLLVASPLCGGRAYAALATFFEKVLKSYAESANIVYNGSKDDIYAWMDGMLRNQIEVKEEKLCIDPVFSGKRECPEERGRIYNIGLSNFTPEAFTYAMLEGIVNELYTFYDGCDTKLKVSMKHLIASGNGVRKNLFLQQIFTSTFGMKTEISEYLEEAACGAAIYAGSIQILKE